MIAEVEHWDNLPLPDKQSAQSQDHDMIKALATELIANLREILMLNPMFRDQTNTYFQSLDLSNPYLMADIATSLTSADRIELQVCTCVYFHPLCVYKINYLSHVFV